MNMGYIQDVTPNGLDEAMLLRMYAEEGPEPDEFGLAKAGD